MWPSSSSTALQILCGLLSILSAAYFFHLIRTTSRLAPLPNGPKGVLLIGHWKILSERYLWRTFTAWSQKYGDIIYMHVWGRPIVVLNKFEHAQELLEKRGVKHSNRPRSVLVHELMKVRSATFMPYGDDWRRHRRLIQQYFNARAIKMYRPLQMSEVELLLCDLKRDPQNFRRHLKRFAASTVLSVGYGYHVSSVNDPFVDLAESTNKILFSHGNPGTTIIDLFPILRYLPSFLPGGHLKPYAARAVPAIETVINQPFQYVEEHRESGESFPSFVSMALSHPGQSDSDGNEVLRHQAIKDVAGSLYRAGVESTTLVLHVFVLAMTLHPEVARKAQAELDSVLGHEQLPTLEDRHLLPYIDCILKECLRWAPPFPLGLPHSSLEEDEIDGKRIPRNSTLIPNIWMMMHDNENYRDPDQFMPERFERQLSDDKSPAELDPTLAVFGFGRRICPGRHFAEATVWLAIASILSTFEISPELAVNGLAKLPVVEFQSGLISKPMPFNCRIVPRVGRKA